MASIISDSPTISSPKGSSAQVHIAAGSGSRPVPSKVKIDTSAPKSPHGLGRKPSGALK